MRVSRARQTSVCRECRGRRDASPSLWWPSGCHVGPTRPSGRCAGRQQCRSGWSRGANLGCRRSGVIGNTVFASSPGEPQGCQRSSSHRLVGVVGSGGPAECPHVSPLAAVREPPPSALVLILSAGATGLTRVFERLLHKPRIGDRLARLPSWSRVKGAWRPVLAAGRWRCSKVCQRRNALVD
jgi:hypothetical protein